MMKTISLNALEARNQPRFQNKDRDVTEKLNELFGLVFIMEDRSLSFKYVLQGEFLSSK